MGKYNLSIEEENRLYEKIKGARVLCVIFAVIAAFLLFMTITLIHERNMENDEYRSDITDYINLKEVAHDDGYYVYYDKNTKVMYYQIRYNGGEFVMSPILNSDGTAKLYEGD